MLKDRVAIITGAARRGIGFGIAQKFAENGCHVILNDILELDEEVLIRVERLKELGIECHFVRADISDSKQVAKIVKENIDTFGKVDILVNNAAYAPQPKSIIDIPEEEWDKTLAVNLKGAFLLCREVVPYMKQARYGKIINISAASGLSPGIMDAHYNSSKAGLIMLTKDVALEFAPFNINVNVICPGIIATELTETLAPQGVDKTEFLEALARKNVPMQRLGYPEDIANAALFFASDLSSYITGEVLLVGGGSLLVRLSLPELKTEGSQSS
jgi:3-oxoacyl-[acyl-carrier protein] reductase